MTLSENTAQTQNPLKKFWIVVLVMIVLLTILGAAQWFSTRLDKTQLTLHSRQIHSIQQRNPLLASIPQEQTRMLERISNIDSMLSQLNTIQTQYQELTLIGLHEVQTKAEEALKTGQTLLRSSKNIADAETMNGMLEQYQTLMIQASQHFEAGDEVSGYRNVIMANALMAQLSMELSGMKQHLQEQLSQLLIDLRLELEEYGHLEGTLQTTLSESQEQVAMKIWILSGILGLIALLLTGLIIRFSSNIQAFQHQWINKLRNHTFHFQGKVHEMHQSFGHLQKNMTQQQAAVENTASSVEQIASMISQTAENTLKSKDLAHAASMQMNHLAETMSAIEEASNRIRGITQTIDSIAFQTNILSLNAAVEAARAGENGLGFSVVADEVRNLASKSAEAARDIAQRIEHNARQAASGMAITQKALLSFEQINQYTEEIASATQEQSVGIGQINQSMYQMSQLIQNNSGLFKTERDNVMELMRNMDGLKIFIEQLSEGSPPDTETSSESATDSKSALTTQQTKAMEQLEQSAHLPAKPLISLHDDEDFDKF
ncbi:MAG: hypothetical protein HQM11_18960 [SAR324 cluster bacterium]|nr:hypothetical protein [SAR324 cluster bacterium]